MTGREAVAFVRQHGVVLQSARGPAPSLAEEIAGGPIRGSWWGHPKGQEIFVASEAIADSRDVLVCRLIGGKVTYVHRRLWPALVRLAGRFRKTQLAMVRNEHTASGAHRVRRQAFPAWVPASVMKEAKALSVAEAEASLQAIGAFMSELKTKPTQVSVESFLEKVADEDRRKDCQTLLRLMKKASGCQPRMWGSSIVGFGSYHYKYASGHSGDWPITAFAPRKQDLTLYIMPGLNRYGDLLGRLGKHKTGKACLYIKRLSEVDLLVLETLVASAVKDLKQISEERTREGAAKRATGRAKTRPVK